MNSLRILSMTLFLAALTSVGISQNTNQNPSSTTFFVRIENLNVDNYPALYHAIKDDGRFKVENACVPAQILTIQVVGTQNADMAKNMSDFQIIATNSQLAIPVILTDFNADRFLEACLAARN